jgi:hypothetical protein
MGRARSEVPVSIETQSKISLISKALVLCGEVPLNGLDDDRYGATVGGNLFELLYESELQSNRWRFAMKKGSLSQLAATPLNEYRYAYQLPADMLLLIGVYPRTNYEVYGDRIYSNNSSCEIEYMFKPGVDDCPAYFSLLMTYALARDMINPITESVDKQTKMEAKYRMQRDRAMFADAQARPSRPVADSPFTSVR